MASNMKSLPDVRTRTWLHSVLPLWAGEGLIAGPAADELNRRYELDSIPSSRLHQWRFIIGALSIIGAIMLGMGVILFFAANWEKVTPTQKVALIFAGIVVTYLAGYEFRLGRWKMPILGEALLLVGAIFFGAAVWLIAQIFNIQEHYPNGALLWGLGILPVAAVLPSALVATLASLLFLLYYGLECYTVSAPNYIYLCLVLAMFWPAYRFRSRWLVLINYLGLAGWFVSSFVILEPAEHAIGPALCLAVSAGIAAYLLARMHAAPPCGALSSAPGGTLNEPAPGGCAASEEHRPLADVYALFGFLAVTVPLFLMTFGSLAGMVQAGFKTAKGGVFFCAGVAVFAAISVFAAAALARRERAEAPRRLPGLALFDAALSVVVAAAAIFLLALKPLTAQWLLIDNSLTALVFNVILALFLIHMIVVGHLREMPLLVGLGRLGVVALLAARYFDMFWGLMSRSQFFMIGGALLLFVVWLMERMRKRLPSDPVRSDPVRVAAKEVDHA